MLASVGVSADVVSPEQFTAVIAAVVVTTAGSAILARMRPGADAASSAAVGEAPEAAEA